MYLYNGKSLSIYRVFRRFLEDLSLTWQQGFFSVTTNTLTWLGLSSIGLDGFLAFDQLID